MRLAVLQPSVQSVHAALALHSRTSSRTPTTIGGLGDRNVSADRPVLGDGIAGVLSKNLQALIIVATKRADHVVLPEFYAVLAAVEADVMETIVPYSIVRR